VYVHKHNIASIINKATSTLFRIIKVSQDQISLNFGRNFNPKYPSTRELPKHKYSSDCPAYDGKPKLMFHNWTSFKKRAELEIGHRCDLYGIVRVLYQKSKRLKKEWYALSIQCSRGCKDRILICELCFNLVLLIPDRMFVKPNKSLLQRWEKNPEQVLGEAGLQVINHNRMQFAIQILDWAREQKRAVYPTLRQKPYEEYRVLCLSILLKILQFKKYSSLRSSLIDEGHLPITRTTETRKNKRTPNAAPDPKKGHVCTIKLKRQSLRIRLPPITQRWKKALRWMITWRSRYSPMIKTFPLFEMTRSPTGKLILLGPPSTIARSGFAPTIRYPLTV
jgi:hypothetical protein